jgi:glycine C-acetyltransferase
MSLAKIETLLATKLVDLERAGRLKGQERIIVGVIPAASGIGPRFLLRGYGNRPFLRMSSNSYLGLSQHPSLIEAGARAAEAYGVGPGAVRFISGAHEPHVELEKRLAAFHDREAAAIMSAAYATMMGALPQLITERTLVVSDALNHNCIINAIRLARPARTAVYTHLCKDELNRILESGKGQVARVCVVTDGIFSMRGDHAPLDQIAAICQRHEEGYEEGIITVVDDSHGVGAFGQGGRGTEAVTGARADVLIATLGKAFGVNGGYVVSSRPIITYLRETAPFYIYSNPISPAEAAASAAALALVDSPEGERLLGGLRTLSDRLRNGLLALGLETIPGEHPIVPLMIRDTDKTSALVKHLFDNNVLVTGLNFPVVPKGDEEIRLQVCACHTEQDIDHVLRVLRER